jgi:hypothetical protein
MSEAETTILFSNAELSGQRKRSNGLGFRADILAGAAWTEHLHCSHPRTANITVDILLATAKEARVVYFAELVNTTPEKKEGYSVT